MDNFIFKDSCTYCAKVGHYYPFLLHGTRGIFYTCEKCIDKAWDHYRSYSSWKPETKAKTMEEFMVLLADYREQSLENQKKLMAEQEIKKEKQEEAKQRFHLKMSKRIDIILDIDVPNDKIFSLEKKLFYKLEEFGIELIHLENTDGKLILSCDKEIPHDIIKILADIADTANSTKNE